MSREKFESQDNEKVREWASPIRTACCSLVATCKVVADPSDISWEGWIDATCCDEDTSVDNSRHTAVS